MSEEENPREASYNEAKQAFDKLELSEKLIFLGAESVEAVISMLEHVGHVVDEMAGRIGRARAKAGTDDN